MSEVSILLFGMGIGVMLGWFWFGNGYKKTEEVVDDWIRSIEWLIKKSKHLTVRMKSK